MGTKYSIESVKNGYLLEVNSTDEYVYEDLEELFAKIVKIDSTGTFNDLDVTIRGNY